MATTATTPPPHPLPDLSHLGSADFERVYEPSDDTFLLVDALAADAASLQVRHTLHATPTRYTLPRSLSHALTLSRSPARSPSHGTGALCRPLHRGRLRLGRRHHSPRLAAAPALGMDAGRRRQRRRAARERGHRGPQRREPTARADGPPLRDAARPDRRAPRCLLLTPSNAALSCGPHSWPSPSAAPNPHTAHPSERSRRTQQTRPPTRGSAP